MSTYSWHNYYLTLGGIWALCKGGTHTLSFGSPLNIMYNMETIWMSSTCLLPSLLMLFQAALCLHDAPLPNLVVQAPCSTVQGGELRGSGRGIRFWYCSLGSALVCLTASLIQLLLLSRWSSWKFSLTLPPLSSIILGLETTSQFDILECCQSLSIGLPFCK